MTVSCGWPVFLFFYYFFVFANLLEKWFAPLKYVDELLAVCAIPLFLIATRDSLKIRKNGVPAMAVLLVIYSLAGLGGNYLWGYQPFFRAALPDLFLNLKFWLCLFTGSYIFRKLDMARYAHRMLFHISLVTWFLFGLLIFDNIFHVFPTEMRYGLRSTYLFYSHPTAVAAISVFHIGLLLSIRGWCSKQKIVLNMILWTVIIASTLRSKAIAGAAAVWLIYYFVFVRKKKLRLRTLLLFVPVLILIGWNQFEFYFLSQIKHDSARYILMKAAIPVAMDHFPFGAGFGTFASHFSGKIYSPLYHIYGISHVHGITPVDTSFISDSFWPMVLGETGFIGLLVFIPLICLLLKNIQRLYRVNRNFYAAALSMFTYIMIVSLAESAFVHPLISPMALWMGCLLGQAEKKQYPATAPEPGEQPAAAPWKEEKAE